MLTLIAASIWTFMGSLSLWAKAGPRGASILLGGGVIFAAQLVGTVLLFGWLGELRPRDWNRSGE